MSVQFHINPLVSSRVGVCACATKNASVSTKTGLLYETYALCSLWVNCPGGRTTTQHPAAGVRTQFHAYGPLSAHRAGLCMTLSLTPRMSTNFFY
jgi:hypothetical protein